MTTYNLNALLQDEAGDGLVDTGEDASLNAGWELPEDNLTVEVEVNPKDVVELVRAQDETSVEAAALESRHNAWSYLRDDIINARGMSLQFAQEAISIKPTFGNNKPLGYYSRHISQTRYSASLEEIDTTMHADLVLYLEKIKTRIGQLSATAKNMTDEDRQHWKRLGGAVSLLGVYFADSVRILEAKGQRWEDNAVIAKVNKTLEEQSVQQAEKVRSLLTNYFLTPAGFGMAMLEQSELYSLLQDFPVNVDLLVQYCDEWINKVDVYTQALAVAGDNNKPKFEMPVTDSINLANGTTVKNTELHAVLRQYYAAGFDFKSARTEPLTVDNCMFAASSAAHFSAIDDLYQRHANLETKLQEYANVVDALIGAVVQEGQYSDKMTFVTTEVNNFAKQLYSVVESVLFALEEMQTTVEAFKNALRDLIAIVMVLVETKNKEVEASTEPALLEDAQFLPSWKESLDKMRNEVAFLC